MSLIYCTTLIYMMLMQVVDTKKCLYKSGPAQFWSTFDCTIDKVCCGRQCCEDNINFYDKREFWAIVVIATLIIGAFLLYTWYKKSTKNGDTLSTVEKESGCTPETKACAGYTTIVTMSDPPPQYTSLHDAPVPHEDLPPAYHTLNVRTTVI